MAEPSFQDVFKLMNAMASFEELLDAISLKPETCVHLGIHEKFKQLYEKIGKCVQHEETKDLTFKSICNVCCNEIKILNCDIRTSVAIHNAGELHRVAAKMVDINKQDQNFGGKSVQQLTDLKTAPNDCILKQVGEFTSDITAKNAEMKVDQKERNLDFEIKSVPCLIDFDNFPTESIKSTAEIANNIAAKNIELKTKSDAQLIDLNNIPNELLKQMLNAHSVSQKEGFVNNNLKANVPSPCASCQQVLCICGYKDKNTQMLNEKMCNVNLHQQGGTHCVPGNFSVPPPPLFPGGIPPQGFKQPQGATARGRNPAPQSRANKNQERRSSSVSTAVERSSPRQYLNVHVHMPTSGGQSPQVYTQPVAAPHHQPQTKRNVQAHMPTSGGQSPQAYTQPAAAPHHQAQTKRIVYVPMPSYGGRSPQAATQAEMQPEAAPRRQSQTKKNSVEEDLELLRSKTLSHQQEMQLMYRMLRQAEGGYWRRNHFTKVYNHAQGRNEYACNVCNTGSRMNCSLHVVQHARGRAHQEALQTGTDEEEEDDRDRKDCVVM